MTASGAVVGCGSSTGPLSPGVSRPRRSLMVTGFSCQSAPERPTRRAPAARFPERTAAGWAWQAWLVIVGIGVDIADISRLQEALRRTPSLSARLFAEGERGARPDSLAGCFAAKEAVAKALGGPPGLRWSDVQVIHDSRGAPRLELRGTVADAAARLGVRTWHLSLSHDGGLSVAMVVAEG